MITLAKENKKEKKEKRKKDIQPCRCREREREGGHKKKKRENELARRDENRYRKGYLASKSGIVTLKNTETFL